MPTRSRDQPQFLYSPAVRVVEGATFGLGSNLAWDAYQRRLYNQQNAIAWLGDEAGGAAYDFVTRREWGS